jgi:hypothetical protein
MSPLVKKEIRLLLPSWIIALLLALIQAITRPYDFYVVMLLFVGMTMMALTTIGREISLNTFSAMLAQPAERTRIWQIKLSVLAVVFLITFGVWLLAYGVAFFNSTMDEAEIKNSYNLFITVCLIATATFTGGLWTTLLLRQLAAAFWLTLLVPATLSGFTAAFVSPGQPVSGVIAVLCVIFGIYSIGGFFFARWLFFRAQDTGWSRGTIVLPEWSWSSARLETAGQTRKRKPGTALLKKEWQLHQTVLTSAAGLFALHLGIIVLRTFHKFPRDSAGDILTSIFWMLWLVLPAIVGCVAIAEERKLGVVEGQVCLPVSRRVQFVIKAFLVFFLGVFLGGLMPAILEEIGAALGPPNPALMSADNAFASGIFVSGTVVFSAWLALVSFFASSLAKNFLQAIGLAIVTFFVCAIFVPLLTNNHMLFYDSIARHSLLQMFVAVPTIVVTLFWLAWLNFKNFRDGWSLWRRNLLGFIGALAFVIAASNGIYNRVWEVFEPSEPAHGQAIFSLANPPVIRTDHDGNLLVQLPDGRVWFDYLNYRGFGDQQKWWLMRWLRQTINPLPMSAGPQRFLSGSNWVSVTAGHVDEEMYAPGTEKHSHVFGLYDSIGIKSDGTLWVSGKSEQNVWTADKLTQFGDETNWQQVVRSWGVTSVLLLKKDGTLWRWGTNHYVLDNWPQKWPGLRAFQPYQINTNSDWSELFSADSSDGGSLAKKTDGTVWAVTGRDMSRNHGFIRETNYDQIVTQKFSEVPFGQSGAYVRKDGTLHFFDYLYTGRGEQREFRTRQCGRDTNWVASAATWSMLVALKTDGTLWKWDSRYSSNLFTELSTTPPTRLGIHKDWVAIAGIDYGVVALAADGSLWYWPPRNSYSYDQILLKLPKQPEFLGNVFGKSD